jgi:hypothetical protein
VVVATASVATSAALIINRGRDIGCDCNFIDFAGNTDHVGYIITIGVTIALDHVYDVCRIR